MSQIGTQIFMIVMKKNDKILTNLNNLNNLRSIYFLNHVKGIHPFSKLFVV